MTAALRWRFAVAVLFATVCGLAYLMYAERIGRLSMDLQYDDVSYALDAADRAEALEHGGVKALVRSLFESPTHSPYSVGLALLGFRTLGLHELTLYLGNLLILWCVALAVVVLTRRSDSGTFAVALSIALPSALAYHAQTEYRPDPAYGLAMAMMVATLASAAVDGQPRRARLAGLLLGAALVIKPTFFAHTLAIAFALMGASFVAGWRRLPAWAGHAALPARELALFLAVGLLAAAPYFSTAAVPIFKYFWWNTFGVYGDVHKMPGGAGSLGKLLEDMAPLIFQLPRYHLHLGAIATAALFTVFVLRRDSREAMRLAILGAAAVLSFVIVLFGGQRSFFFFATMDWLAVFACIAGYVALASMLEPRRRSLLHVVAIAIVLPVAAAGLRDLRASWPWGARHGESENVRMLGLIRQDLAQSGIAAPPMVHVLVDSSGVVNPWVLKWVGRLSGMRVYGEETHVYGDLTYMQRLARQSDYLIVIHPDRAYFDQWLPVARIQRPYRQWALHEPDFERLSGDDNAPYVLIANRKSTRRFTDPPVVSADGVVESVEGLGDDERAPARPIDGGRMRACFALAPGVPYRVSVRYESAAAGRVGIAWADAEPLWTPLAPAGSVAADYTPTAWSQNCVHVKVDAVAGSPPVRLRSLRVEPR